MLNYHGLNAKDKGTRLLHYGMVVVVAGRGNDNE
jgi:hypothetical protein